MKILLVTNEYPTNKIAGTAVATYNLAEFLHNSGHRVKVLLARDANSSRGLSIRDPKLFAFRGDPPRGVGWLFRFLFILKEALRFRPDVIQGQSISCGLLSSLAARLLKIPSITYVQGNDFYQATQLQMKSEVRLACHLSSVLVCVTKDLARRIRDRSGKDNIQVIPHGFESKPDPNFPVTAPIEGTDQLPAKILLSVGRLEMIKGHDILLKAWPAVTTVCPEARLWIVGDGAERRNLFRLCHDLNISDTVRFFGKLTARQVATVMARADIFVMPSRWESFGIVLLEAMFNGLPVVSTLVGGIPEVLPPKGDVIRVTDNDPASLAGAILQGLRCFHKPSTSNRAWAEAFQWTNIAPRFLKLYESLKAKQIVDING